jgi:2-keto-4-pentenoate hydratase/2-oxohepta-3-ene-1,7-dioic acid hydratase in catechol pathway
MNVNWYLEFQKMEKYIQERHAGNYYNGITVGIDFTARDIQDELKKKGLPWEKAKAFDNSAAVGKFLEINTALGKKNINFSLFNNKELVQKGNSNQMIFSFDSIISHISNYFSLNIGDLIFTGTPAGVGECVVGDELEALFGRPKPLKLGNKVIIKKITYIKTPEILSLGFFF